MKVARLVSQQWNRLITPAPFNDAFIAPHRKVLEIFTSISQHKIYSKCVTELYIRLAVGRQQYKRFFGNLYVTTIRADREANKNF